MLLEIILVFIVFVCVLGLGWPITERFALNPVEKVVGCVGVSLLVGFIFSWAIYVLGLPKIGFWVLPILGGAALVFRGRSLQVILRDPAVRNLLFAQLLITAWCLGWLALVKSYSGGNWIGDWYGHLQRTWFFLQRWPTDILFNGFDAVTSRPPLANVVNGALLAVTRQNFAHYQIASTLLSSVVFLPAALLASRWGRVRSIPLLAALFMLNPMFIQNATYTWTKLLAAFFCLGALYFFLRARDVPAPRIALPWCAAFLAGGFLTHYSAGPYVVFLALAWLISGYPNRHRDAEWGRTTLLAGTIGGAILATWFGWALVVYGVRGTFLTNTTVTDQAGGIGMQLQVIALNVRDTFVPHFFRDVDWGIFEQASVSGWWRDWFFNLYQTNLLWAFGSVAWIGILGLLAGGWRDASRPQRGFWTAFILVNVIIGIAVHGGRNVWGLAPICLQPLVLLGLAFLAARWDSLSRGWRLLLIAGATLDFLGGIVLHFGVESGWIDQWMHPQRGISEIFNSYSRFAQANLHAKQSNHWVFVGDSPAIQPGLMSLWLAMILLLGWWRARQDRTGPAAPAGVDR